MKNKAGNKENIGFEATLQIYVTLCLLRRLVDPMSLCG